MGEVGDTVVDMGNGWRNAAFDAIGNGCSEIWDMGSTTLTGLLCTNMDNNIVFWGKSGLTEEIIQAILLDKA